MSATRAEQITAGLIWRVQCRYVGGLRCVESGVCAVFLMMWGVLCGVFEGEGKSWPVLGAPLHAPRCARSQPPSAMQSCKAHPARLLRHHTQDIQTHNSNSGLIMLVINTTSTASMAQQRAEAAQVVRADVCLDARSRAAAAARAGTCRSHTSAATK